MPSPDTSVSCTCRPLHGLPEVAGLGTIREMMSPGLSVQEVVDFLKHSHYALHRLWRIFLSRLTAEPVYELKMAWSYHAYLCSGQITALRDRVAEMRHPPLGLEKIPHDALRLFFDEIQAAPTSSDLIDVIYRTALPALRDAMHRHLGDTRRVAAHDCACKIAKCELRHAGILR